MPKDGYVSVTIREEDIDIAYDLAQVADLSIPKIISLSLKYYKKNKLKELKERARVLG